MPFLFKLARRLGIGRASVVAALASTACGVDTPTAVDSFGNIDARANARTRVSSTAPASIAISPSSASGSLGQTAQFTATVYDGAGRVVSNAIADWSSGDSTIVAVTSSGLATAVGVGTTQLVARSGTLMKTADVSVSGVPIATITVTPGSAAGDVGDSAPFTATLKDAGGNTLTGRRVLWTSSAPGVVTVDSTGLARAVGPGTATLTAYSAGKSGLATATVNGASAPPPPPAPTVARVEVSPSSASGNVGDAAQFSATVYDANNAVMSGQTITWATTNAAIVTVTASGYATATGPGTANLVATAGGKQGTSTITVLGTAPPPPPPDTTTSTSPSTGWANAPAWATITDQPFDLLTSLDWFLSFSGPAITLDLAAPLSAPTVLQFTYPAGIPGGGGTGTVAHGLPNARRLYAGFWFKASSNWQGHNSNVNKLSHIFGGGTSGEMYIAFYGTPGGPYELRTALEFSGADSRFWLPPNAGTKPVLPGTWHKVELLVDMGTSGAANGVVKYWLDGTLVGSYSDVRFPSASLIEYQVAPTWGGMGDVKQHTDYIWFDHVIVKGY